MVLAKALSKILRHQQQRLKAFKHSDLLEQVRRKLPRVFYMAVKRATNFSKMSTIAISFRHSVVDGVLEHPPSFQQYLNGLYRMDGPEYQLPWVPRSSYFISVSPEDVLQATRKLSSGKALGIDRL